MTKGRLQHSVDKYRAQLQRNDAEAEHALEVAYQHALKAVQPQIDHLMQQIEQARAAGEDVNLAWLLQGKRLEHLQNFLSNQINHFGQFAKMTTEQLQHEAAALGQEAAQAHMDATVPNGVNWTFSQPSPHAMSAIIGATRDGSPLSDLFSGFGAEAGKGAKEALITGITLGQAPKTVAKGIQDALGVSRARALTIAHNEMMNAYRGASLANYRQNSDIVDGWIWLADLSGACLACTEENGSEHPLDEDMAPHVRCRCSPVPKTKSYADILGLEPGSIDESSNTIESGADWFARQDEATQREKLGSNARYKLYQDGMPLSDMVGTKDDPDWGSSIYIKPMKDLVGAK